MYLQRVDIYNGRNEFVCAAEIPINVPEKPTTATCKEDYYHDLYDKRKERFLFLK
ncbi:MAG: hypothetical protein H6765_05410 [Candidatus Peribacteria bacterium]|nr:MAG: hypothetical protein H6765_05410 [Candidatus Peribacteria bacterium]